MKNRFLAILSSCSLMLASPQILAQDDPTDNYIPDTIEKIIDRPSDGESKIPIKDRITKETVANSIFLYEGYGDTQRVRDKGFGERYMENLEKELDNASPLRIYETTRDLEYSEEMPFEREIYSAMGKTLIEKYPLFRNIDKEIKKVRDATTLKFESGGGTKYRLGPYINKADLGEIGAFLKIRSGKFDVALVGCQNSVETYIQTRKNGWTFRLSHEYKTGASGDRPEQETYLAISR